MYLICVKGHTTHDAKLYMDKSVYYYKPHSLYILVEKSHVSQVSSGYVKLLLQKI